MGIKYIMSFAPWIGTSSENTAIIKPKRDIIASAKELGYKEVLAMEDLHYNRLNVIHQTQIWRRLKRKFFANFSSRLAIKKNIQFLETFFKSLTGEDTLLLQYPIYGDHSPEIFATILKILPSLKLNKKVILIHDIETMNRTYKKYVTKEEEIEFIKSFDDVILHNSSMVDYYQESDDNCTYYTLDLFDYRLSEQQIPVRSPKNRQYNTVFYAGNLMKAPFLNQTGRIPNFEFHIYGPGFNISEMPNNLIYHGSISPDSVIMEGAKYGFGLVWDGDSIDDLTGLFGEYMKYNNPYKLSCNIASGLPIVTSKKAGIAPFVKQNNLGILVDSLLDLNNICISEETYRDMMKNVLYFQRKIVNGDMIKNILNKIDQS